LRARADGPARTPVRQRVIWTVAGFGTLALAACLFAPLVGSTRIHLTAVFDRSIPYADNIDAQIFFVARLPRVLAAALVGSALALSGVVFQALLRNPLASPDTLGVSAGASLGAMMAITFNFDFSLGIFYIFPVIVAAMVLKRWQVVVAAVLDQAHAERPEHRLGGVAHEARGLLAVVAVPMPAPRRNVDRVPRLPFVARAVDFAPA